MNKEYVLEKLAQENIYDYIGRGPHPIATGRGVYDMFSKQNQNLKMLRTHHNKHMKRTGLPMTLGQYIQEIEAGNISNPLKPGFLARYGKASLLAGAGAIAGIAGYTYLKDKAEQSVPQNPELVQVYNTPGGQEVYGK